MASPDLNGESPPLQALAQVAVADRREGIAHALDAARELLGMDIAYFSEFSEGKQVIKEVRGDRDTIQIAPGDAVPLEDTYCRRMLAGQLSNVVPDAQRDPRVTDLAATSEAGIGSYLGVPIQLSDGRVHGTLCCASSSPNERLGSRDVQFMRVLARLIADDLERERNGVPEAREAAQAEVPGTTLKLDLWFVVAPRAAATARAALEVLSEHISTSRLHDARLLVTELMTNSIRHSGAGRESSIALALRLQPDRLSVAISDPGPGFRPQVAEPDLEQEGGRGLFIVDSLADRWGVGDSPLTPPREGGNAETGTVVWFELERPQLERAAA